MPSDVLARLIAQAEGEGATLLTLRALAEEEGFLSQAIIVRTFEETIAARSEWRRLARSPVKAITSVQGLPAEGAAFALPVENYAIDIDADCDGWVRVSDPAGAGRVIVTYDAGIAPGWAGLPS
jgi:hypothetical protein